MVKLRNNAHLLRNLVTFEVASRSVSFTQAAEEMGVSRVAVSRHIADLERSIGQTLFVRGHRNVVLTAAGATFAKQINPALDRIADAIERQRSAIGGDRLSVTVTSAFATYWLMPRLINFGARFPDIEVNLVVSDRYLDLNSENIDIAIRYMPPPADDDQWRPFLQETIFPVYSPSYQARTLLQTPSDLCKERLLYLSGRYKSEAKWPHWFQIQGITPPEERVGVHVNTYINMLQAAIEGQGIALAGHPLVDKFLEDGTLLRVERVPVLARDKYYLKCRSPFKSAENFCVWLEGQIGN